jgi:hypothetical protein
MRWIDSFLRRMRRQTLIYRCRSRSQLDTELEAFQ